MRAKGLDGSSRNGEMSRTGAREGLKRKCFLSVFDSKILSDNGLYVQIIIRTYGNR